MSLDLIENDVDGVPWDFHKPAKREKAEQLVRSKKAIHIIGSPMCSAFIQIQGLNFCEMSPEDIETYCVMDGHSWKSAPSCTRANTKWSLFLT